ncbi:MAG TPA: hypothetical protein VMU04_10335 [Candidatus Acidoferrum sp.]|nr:hypothetical protein [Candidatus Acidoferrum sp.]
MITAAGQSKPHFSIPSIIAIAAAIGSFFVGAAGGFALALIAIFFGIIGLVLALSPSVRGGFVSVLSLFLASIGILVAIAKAIAWAV